MEVVILKINKDLLLSANNLKADLNEHKKNARSTDNNSLDKIIDSETKEVKSAIKIIEKNGYTITAKDVESIREFMSSDGADKSDKLNAIKEAFSKEMPLNNKLLSALSGYPKMSLLDFIEPIELREIKGGENTTQSGTYTREDLNKIDNNLKKIIKELDKLEKSNNLNSKENDKSEKNSNDKSITKTDLETSTNNSNNNIANGEEETNKEMMNAVENNIIVQDRITENLLEDIAMIQNYVSSAISINNHYDTYIETKITPKLLKLKNEFIDFKKDVIKTLDKVEAKGISKADKRNILLETVEKIDSKIMKSEMSLFMDLKGERELLKISSKLQEAIKLIKENKVSEAEKIIKSQVTILDKMKYEPSIKKAVALSSIKQNENNNLKTIKSSIYKSAEGFTVSDKSASSVVNYLRKLGINHEVENFEKYISQNNNSKEDFVNIKNIKEMLLALKNNTKNQNDYQKASSMITSIDKSQVKNKIADNKSLQTVSFDIPLKIDGRIKNVKVFIKSPQKELKLDWENFNMFFAFDTDKLGKIGIRVVAVNKNLNISITNDEISISSSHKIKEDLKKDVEEFGYKVIKMVLQLWKKDDLDKTKEAPKEQAMTTMEGFDYTI